MHIVTTVNSNPVNVVHWIYLGIAILCEVIATSALKSASGFTRPFPAVVVVLGYALAFYLLSLALRTIPLGVAYAIWSGVGLALVALVGWIAYGELLDGAAILGLALIGLGVLVLSLVSKVTLIH